MTENTIAEEFFATYTRALLDRDAAAIARHYAVPGLIEFPEQPIAVTSVEQAEQFFASAFGQYEGVSTARPHVEVLAATDHSVWADVTWSYDGGVPGEHNLYQLVRSGDEWKIAVLTPMDA